MSDLAGHESNSRAYYAKYQNQLGTGSQRPSPTILFIGCFDSRVIPELILGTKPGEMMAVRVPGGLVPGQGEVDFAISAGIELTLSRMPSITEVVVCGHTDCVMLNTLAAGVDANQYPNLARWIDMNDHIKTEIHDHNDHDRAILEKSVIQSLKGLRDIDLLRQKELAGQLRVHGWIFELETGQIFAFNEFAGQFEILAEPATKFSA
ncbi:MAG: hypothetical protein HY862_20895 [Chloroflexi bacterium]|nr:hypothetical protein [Chloroflexota bacterium]